MGDLLDRGDQELPLLFWMERLRRQAAAAGGALHVLNGNHESMNVAGQYRYVTRGAMHRCALVLGEVRHPAAGWWRAGWAAREGAVQSAQVVALCDAMGCGQQG